MQINSCFEAIGKSCLSRYLQLHYLKSSEKIIINYYKLKMNYSILCLHNESFEVVDSIIQRNYKIISLLNHTAM